MKTAVSIEPALQGKRRRPAIYRRSLEYIQLLRLLMTRNCQQAEKVYDFLGTHNNLAENSLYLNLGYWQNCKSYDQACEQLARLLADKAGLKAGKKLLDVGCGFGDAAAYWLKAYQLASVHAINISELQLQHARQRWKLPSLHFHLASAMRLPFEDESMDAVLALESTFHFPDRARFFQEAWRVLKPNGVLAMADLFPTDDAISLRQRLVERIGRSLWQIPKANWHSAEICQEKLKHAGYREISCLDISEQVFVPFKNYARRRVQDKKLAQRLNPLLKKAWAAEHGALHRSKYVILVARKP